MRFIILILFLGSVLAEEKVAKADDKQSVSQPVKINPIEEVKSKTEKRDSSVQTSSFGIDSNAEPFKPMLNPPVKYEVAASTNQQVYYGNKNGATAGNAKNGASSQTANAFRGGQYSQVATQTQPQQQQQPLLNKNAGKNVGAQQQQQVQQQVLYAVPQNPPNHYERVSPQPPLQQQPPHQLPVQRKQSQYVIAIPLSYLRQLQQQLVQHPQQQEQQIYKGQQQFQLQLQPQQQQQAIYSVAGPLARDHQGAYRPFHRFALTPVNDVSTAGVQHHHQIGSPAPIPAPALAAAPAPPGYVTQYVQIPASVLMAALQSAQVQPQQRTVHLAQPVYQQAQHPQQQYQQQALQQPPQQQLQPQAQYQQTIPQQQHQHIQAPASQIFYLQPHPQQQLQPSQALTAPPVYGYHVNPLQQQQQQLQQPTQQHQQYVAEQQQQQQQVNVGKQTLRVRGIGSQVNYAPPQYDTSPAVYEHAHSPTYSNAHGQQYFAQEPIAQPAQSHQVVQAQQLQSPDTYGQVIHHHYSPQYHTAQQQQQPQPQQQLRQSYQPQQHRFQVQPTASAPQLPSSPPPPPPPPPSPSSPPAPHQQQQPQHSTPFVEHLNNLQLSQGIHGPTPLPYLDLHPPSAVSPYYNFNAIPPTVPQPFGTSAFQHSFTPLGVPNKVASFTNVVFQPFGGHSAPYHVQEINSAVAGSPDTVPYYHQAGGVRYGTHVLHPPTSAATYLAGGKPTAGVVTHPSPRVSNEQKISASSAKSSVAGNPNLVKYP